MGGSGAIRRREFIATGVAAAGALALGPAFLREALAAGATAGDGPYGPLGEPNDVFLRLPEGFTGRQIARGGTIVEGTTYPWHYAPDGQATFFTSDGGFVLVSNSEAPAVLGGGSSAIRFGADGSIQRAYRILGGTNLNCAGGPTPWGTWLSCEEHDGGMVWEADPAGVLPARPRPALGNFTHEAAAVDPVGEKVYMTEDEGDGGFYRFAPDEYPSLASGVLEVAVVAPGGGVSWERVPDANVVTDGKPTREQVPGMTRFKGGEGIWYDGGVVYFTTKGDRRVWAYDARASTLEVLYDHAERPDASLDAVDNVTVSPFGDVYVCEDGGNMEIGLITPDRVVAPFCQLVGPLHDGSEMCGVVFDPSGTRMYFSSQRAYPHIPRTPIADGAVYEVTGPFRLPEGGVPEESVYGPPAGERGELPGLPDGLSVRVREHVGLGSLVQAGLVVTVGLDRGATVHAVLRTPDLERESRGDGTADRPIPVTLAREERALGAGRRELRLRLSPEAVARLAGSRGVHAILTVVAESAGEERRVAAVPLRAGAA